MAMGKNFSTVCNPGYGGAVPRTLLTALLLFLPATAAAQTPDSPPGEKGTVLHVLDGGVVLVQFPEHRRGVPIKLIGLEPPRKASRDEEGQEPWGTRAQQFLVLKVARKEVRVEYDVVVPVGDGKTRWGYLWLGDKLLNEEVLRQGHAVLDTQPPNIKYVERLQAAQREAREKQRSIWDAKDPLPEPPGRFSAKKEAAKEERKLKEEELSIPKFEEGCVIGNRKSKKFHLPGSRYYESSKTSTNAIFFKTKEDAIKAGYTQAG
jgi:endonuclease YncB( thermonuclease family)